MTCSAPQPNNCRFCAAEFNDWPEKIAATLARIEAKQEDLRTELLGNGQPGRVQRLEHVERGTAERVAALEAAHNQQIGKHSVITVIVALVVSLIVSLASAAINEHLRDHRAPQQVAPQQIREPIR